MSTALLKSARALLSMRYVSFSGALGRAAKSVPSWFNIYINCVSGQLCASQVIFAPLFNHIQKDSWYFCHYLHRGTSHGQTSCYEWHLCGLTVNLESLYRFLTVAAKTWSSLSRSGIYEGKAWFFRGKGTSVKCYAWYRSGMVRSCIVLLVIRNKSGAWYPYPSQAKKHRALYWLWV